MLRGVTDATNPAIRLERTMKHTRTLVRITGSSVEIRTGYPANKCASTPVCPFYLLTSRNMQSELL